MIIAYTQVNDAGDRINQKPRKMTTQQALRSGATVEDAVRKVNHSSCALLDKY